MIASLSLMIHFFFISMNLRCLPPVMDRMSQKNKAIARIGVLEADVDLSRFDIFALLDFV